MSVTVTSHRPPVIDLVEAVRTRRSGGRLLDESPSDAELARLLTLAMNSPDHAGLRPWRLVVLRDEARIALGEAMAAAAPEANTERTASKPLRAPLLVGIVFAPRPHPKVPEWEQLAATSAVVVTLCLLLHGHGWRAMWRTGSLIDADPVRAAMGVAADERLLGWLYVGLPDSAAIRPSRNGRDPYAHLSVLAAPSGT